MKCASKACLLLAPFILFGAGCAQQYSETTPSQLLPITQKPIIPPSAKNIPPPSLAR